MTTENSNTDYLTLQNFPFRESINICRRLQLVVWHDAEWVNSHYQVAELHKEDPDGKKHYKQLAAFRYESDFLKYVAQLNFANYY